MVKLLLLKNKATLSFPPFPSVPARCVLCWFVYTLVVAFQDARGLLQCYNFVYLLYSAALFCRSSYHAVVVGSGISRLVVVVVVVVVN